jgi:hypothetical protein
MFQHTYPYEEILVGVEGVKGEEMGSTTTASLIFFPLYSPSFLFNFHLVCVPA